MAKKPTHLIDNKPDLTELMMRIMHSRHTIKCHPKFTHIGEGFGCERCSLTAHFNRMVVVQKNRDEIEDRAADAIQAKLVREEMR